MADWKSVYDRKLMPAEEALKCVKSDSRVLFEHACGEPQHLVQALVARAQELRNVEIVHMVAMGKGEYAKPEYEGIFRHNSLFVGASTRQALKDHRADFTPCFFSEIPRMLREGYLPVDVLLMQCTPPDEDGYCSYGVSVDYTMPVTEHKATIKVAQVNREMPWTYPSKFHVSQVDYFVEYDEPVLGLPPAKIGELEKLIGQHIAELIPNGATLQLGIGGIPDAVLMSLMDKKDLGIHSEMFSDCVVDLVEAGVINGQRKNIHTGKLTATFLMGSRKLYDFVDHNPMVEMLPVDYTNDPCIIGQYDNMISINSALQVDFMGQVNAEMIGSSQFSGIGGQVDFVRGASRSKGGKSIIALPSTAAKGKISRIVADLDSGSAVSTSRNDVHYVVTEYGVAELRGKNLRQRAQALIAIAHPDFREDLTSEAKARGLV